MLTLKGIQQTMDKLNRRREDGKAVEGEIVFDASRGGENRYSYYYKGQLVFTFGITRSPRQKSKQFHYAPRQMFLQRQEYRRLYNCPMSKREYNEKLIAEGKIRQ
jgi:hypothetical protein